MAAAAATAVALKSVPPTVSLANGGGAAAAGLSAAHLAAMAAAVAPLTTPAKRPALADAKSGLPMFDYGQQGLYTLQTQAQAHLEGNKNIQPAPQTSQQPQSKLSPPMSGAPAATGSGGVVVQENGLAGQENGLSGEVEIKSTQTTAVGQFYPETCESIPCFLMSCMSGRIPRGNNVQACRDLPQS